MHQLLEPEILLKYPPILPLSIATHNYFCCKRINKILSALISINLKLKQYFSESSAQK